MKMRQGLVNNYLLKYGRKKILLENVKYIHPKKEFLKWSISKPMNFLIRIYEINYFRCNIKFCKKY